MTNSNKIISSLSTACTRDDAGRHFTEWLDWQLLETFGLIEINRPIHEHTGIPYDQQYWSLQVTDLGGKLLDSE